MLPIWAKPTNDSRMATLIAAVEQGASTAQFFAMTEILYPLEQR